MRFPHNPLEHFLYSARCKPHNTFFPYLLPVCNNCSGKAFHTENVGGAVPFLLFSVSPQGYHRSPQSAPFSSWLHRFHTCVWCCCTADSGGRLNTVLGVKEKTVFDSAEMTKEYESKICTNLELQNDDIPPRPEFSMNMEEYDKYRVYTNS